MVEKACIKCGITKTADNTHKNKKAKDGLASSCKECRRKYLAQNRERIAERTRQYYKKNTKRYQALRENNKEEKKEYDKKRYSDNKAEISEKQKEYYEKNKQTILRRSAKRHKERINTDPAYKLRHNVSRMVSLALHRGGHTKGGSTFAHLPYTPQQLKEHIENQFEPWMTWDNWGEWHIDHIIPQSALLYDSLEHPNFQKCWDLKNLRPLCAKENIYKSNKH